MLPDVYVEMNGGLANQLFQWAVVETRLIDVSGRRVWDYRRALRPNGRGRQLARLALHDEPALTGSPLARALERSLDRLPDRVSAPAMARLPSTPPRRSLVQVHDWRAAAEVLRGGRSVWIRDYLIDPTAIESSRSSIRAAVLSGLPRRDVHTRNYACVHVRRGDYLDPIVAQKLGPCDIAYFLAAIRALDEGLPVKIVSDDPAWCAHHLIPLVEAGTDVEVVTGGTDLDDLATIAGAAAIVMSNSTFSWWGAFLSDAAAVFCPAPFFDFDRVGSGALSRIATDLLDKRSGAVVGRRPDSRETADD